MILTQDVLKEIAKFVNSPDKRKARVADYKRFLLFHGSTETIIKEAIAREYAKPETVEELSGRIIPINFTGKIINKLAGVYTQNPVRRSVDRNSKDQELMEMYEEQCSINLRFKEANRYFKLYKRNLMEICIDDMGYPLLRNLPRHSYEVISFSSITPSRPDVIIKIVSDDMTLEKQMLHVWSNESMFKIDGRGDIIDDPLNIENVNRYSAIPFIYINESSFSVDPIQDDDLMRMSIALPVILTDICWATKYQSNSLLWTIGDVGTIPSAPNSVVSMNYGPNGEKPEIGQIKPEVDTDKVISMVQTLVALLLSTKNLSVNTIQASLSSTNSASGISKMLDSAESVEDKKDQQAYFEKAEHELWDLIAKKMVPAWRGELAPQFNREFSKNFSMDVFFTEPKVMISEMDQIEISKARLEAGFSTLKMELQSIYPQLTSDQVDELAMEIEEYNKQKMQNMLSDINQEEDDAEEGQEDEDELQAVQD